MNPAVQHVPPLFEAAIKAISDDRFGPYLRAAEGDRIKGLHLYHWNMRASAAIYEALHIVEIALRNTIDEQFSIWNQTQTNRTTGATRSAVAIGSGPTSGTNRSKRQDCRGGRSSSKAYKTSQGCQPVRTSPSTLRCFGSTNVWHLAICPDSTNRASP